MKIVIQCASRKAPNAGQLRDKHGRPVIFVARPELAPSTEGVRYQRPDDLADELQQTWRNKVVALNNSPETNLLGLKRAIELYDQPIYTELARSVPSENLYILSAGWGLIGSNFLTPYYDITFSNQAEPWKKRRKTDQFNDLNTLTIDDDDELIAFCTPDYHPLLERLCAKANCRKVLFRRTGDVGSIKGFESRYFSTATRTNWHYECARDFLATMPKAR
jgi:hypothetical protein